MSPSPRRMERRGERAAASALRDRWVERVARLGLMSRAANYTVLAVLLTLVLVGRGNPEVDRRGAVQTLSSSVLGKALLIVLCAGLAAYVVWQLLRATVHRSDQGGAANTWRRLLAVGTAVLYAGFLFSTVRVLFGDSTKSPQQDQDALTGNLLNVTAGRLLVVLGGCAVVVIGLVLFGYAASRRFELPLNMRAMDRSMRRAVTVLGVVGQSARALVFVIVGGFVISAGVTADPSKSKGLDASLKTLASQRFGALALSVVALGFLAFGMYSVVEARYRDDFSR